MAELAAQAGEQLERLKAAAPGGPRTPRVGRPGAGGRRPSPRWLRGQVAAAATSHATACVDQSAAGRRCSGSIAAGLRGQDGQLA